MGRMKRAMEEIFEVVGNRSRRTAEKVFKKMEYTGKSPIRTERDWDTFRADVLEAVKKNRIQAEGQCFRCGKMGHVKFAGTTVDGRDRWVCSKHKK